MRVIYYTRGNPMGVKLDSTEIRGVSKTANFLAGKRRRSTLYRSVIIIRDNYRHFADIHGKL